MTNTKLYTATAPAHKHSLFVAPRPIPGRQVGRCHGMVFDVSPEFQTRARELDGQLITVVTDDEYANLVESALTADASRRYSRPDYEDAGVWDPIEIGTSLGMALVTIEPV
jgi:hypothetical protein